MLDRSLAGTISLSLSHTLQKGIRGLQAHTRTHTHCCTRTCVCARKAHSRTQVQHIYSHPLVPRKHVLHCVCVCMRVCDSIYIYECAPSPRVHLYENRNMPLATKTYSTRAHTDKICILCSTARRQRRTNPNCVSLGNQHTHVLVHKLVGLWLWTPPWKIPHTQFVYTHTHAAYREGGSGEGESACVWLWQLEKQQSHTHTHTHTNHQPADSLSIAACGIHTHTQIPWWRANLFALMRKGGGGGGEGSYRAYTNAI